MPREDLNSAIFYVMEKSAALPAILAPIAAKVGPLLAKAGPMLAKAGPAIKKVAPKVGKAIGSNAMSNTVNGAMVGQGFLSSRKNKQQNVEALEDSIDYVLEKMAASNLTDEEKKQRRNKILKGLAYAGGAAAALTGGALAMKNPKINSAVKGRINNFKTNRKIVKNYRPGTTGAENLANRVNKYSEKAGVYNNEANKLRAKQVATGNTSFGEQAKKIDQVAKKYKDTASNAQSTLERAQKHDYRGKVRSIGQGALASAPMMLGMLPAIMPQKKEENEE